MQKTIFGIDHLLLKQNRLKDLRIGLVTNNAALTSAKEHGRLALLKKGFNIVKIFSPEHGLAVKGADGTYQSNSIDLLTDLPVISLYGDHLMPVAEDMADIDMLLFDIPDVGCRFYTYLWTMSYVMEASALYNKPLIILDRPNPIGGNINKAEGPLLDEKNCSSFIGRWNIPIRHSCTLGELATYFSVIRKMDIDLTVIRITCWDRNEPALENNFSFIPTSPAISSIETALCYPGTGLFEGININEGRGTNKPFTIFGAPWINTNSLNDKLNLPGVSFSEIKYTPNESLYAGESCTGLSVLITDEDSFRPVHTGIAIIQQLLLLFPEQCKERLYKTAANPSGEKHLDKLLGIETSFSKLKAGDNISTELKNEWQEKITPFLLYD
ncbi:MAG: DUF1343 domain-containing protein [Ferruginibacter sp.]